MTSCTSFKEKYIETYAMSGKQKINFKKKSNSERLEFIDQCSKNWKYLVMTEPISLEIIQYTKAYNVDLFSYPAVLICRTNKNDTIRILSLNQKSDLKTNENITVVPDTSVGNQQMRLIIRDKPLFLAKNKKEDKYFCEVKKTYIATIKK